MTNDSWAARMEAKINQLTGVRKRAALAVLNKLLSLQAEEVTAPRVLDAFVFAAAFVFGVVFCLFGFLAMLWWLMGLVA